MDRQMNYTSAMTNLKWDNTEDYNAIQSYINSIREESGKLKKALGGLVFHCIDYNQGAESLVLAMEIEKARQTLKELEP